METKTRRSFSRIEAKRRPFFAAAEPLFERYGFRKTTVEDVCRAAGASKRTFYELFEDKADLASRLVLHAAQSIVSDWQERLAPGMSAVDKLECFLEEYVRLGQEHRIVGLMMTDPDLLRAFGHLAQDRQFEVLIDVLRGVLVEGMRSGEFRTLDPEAVTWIIYALLDTMYYLLPAMNARPGPLDDPRLAAEIHAFIIQALLPGRSRRSGSASGRVRRARPRTPARKQGSGRHTTARRAS